MTRPTTINPGQRWTFVHPEGKRVSYVIGEDTEAGEDNARIVQLVNTDTGRIGWVTRHWMRRPEGNSYGWFLSEANSDPSPSA